MRASSLRRSTWLTSSAICRALGGGSRSSRANTARICGSVRAGVFPPQPPPRPGGGRLEGRRATAAPRRLQAADQRVGRHIQHVALAPPAERGPEGGGPSQLVVAGHPAVRQRGAALEQVQADPPALPEG